jgi:hypothetical protein
VCVQVGFNAPMVRYAAAGDADNGRAAVRELKQLVKDCHSNGLEVRADFPTSPRTTARPGRHPSSAEQRLWRCAEAATRD